MTLSKAVGILDIKIDEFIESFHSLHYKRKGAPVDLKDAERNLLDVIHD